MVHGPTILTKNVSLQCRPLSLNVTFTFLLDQVEDFISLSQTPLDGSQLTDIMHNRYMVWLPTREFLTTVFLLTFCFSLVFFLSGE